MGRRSVTSQVEEAKKHGMLHLIQYQLTHIPPELFLNASSGSSSGLSSSGELATTLVRLDLSFNQLEGPQAIPDTIGSLMALRELYVNNNSKLKQLPSALVFCTKLQVLDASCSALEKLPQELGRLQHLRLINIENTPLQCRWEEKGHLVRRNEDDDPLIFSADSNNNTSTASTMTSSPNKVVSTLCQQILRKLRRKDEREQLKLELFDLLRNKVYRLERLDDSVAASEVLHSTLHRVLKLFPQAVDVRSLLRNTERLFPGEFSSISFEKLDATRLRRDFDVLKTATERKKRAADLELKIRNLYFDRIDPTTVEKMVHQIYAHLPELSDIKFLIKYASRLFPKEARNVDGAQIQRDVLALQHEFARERAIAIDKLLVAVKTLYSETEPDSVRTLITSVAALFKNTKELLSLAADASVLFPTEFLSAHPADIRAGFLRMKVDVMGGSRGGNANNSANNPSRLVVVVHD